MGKQTAGTATAERQTDGTPQGICGENTVVYKAREFVRAAILSYR